MIWLSIDTIRIILMGIGIAGMGYILFGNIKTPKNFRIVSDILQNIFLFIFLLAFIWPSGEIIIKSCYLGIFVMIFDYILETVAVKLKWWFPKGGFQKSPWLIIPLEMVVSFFIIGTSTAFLYSAPQIIREQSNFLINWLIPIFRNQNLDNIWRTAYVLIIAMIGTNGDYGAGSEIWQAGPKWKKIYTFFVWFGGGLLSLLIYNLIFIF